MHQIAIKMLNKSQEDKKKTLKDEEYHEKVTTMITNHHKNHHKNYHKKATIRY